jgi:chromosome segregation ATPase
MKKMFFTTVLLVCFGISLLGQNNELMQLQNKVTLLENSNQKLSNQIKANQKSVADLTIQLNELNANIAALKDDLAASKQVLAESNDRILQMEKKTDDKFTSLGKSVSNSTLFWIIAFLVVACITLLLNWQLKSRISKEKKEITGNIKTGNEQLRDEFGGLLTKKADDIKYMVTGEIKEVKEKFTSFGKAHEDLRDEFRAKLKLATDAFDEQKNKLEQQIKNLIEEGKKPKTQPKTEA